MTRQARARLFAVLLAGLGVVGPACQCFVPVDEAGEVDAGTRRDAGAPASDGGADAGLADAGQPPLDGGAECVTWKDCTGTPWAPGSCVFNAAAPGFSCVEGRCVSECTAGFGRTCHVDAGTGPLAECLTCSDGTAICNGNTCPTAAFTATVATIECRPGVTAPFDAGVSLSFVPLHDATCELSVGTPGFGLGQVVRGGLGQHSWFVRALGGFCVGEQLPTGALRSRVACPLCTFRVEGF